MDILVSSCVKADDAAGGWKSMRWPGNKQSCAAIRGTERRDEAHSVGVVGSHLGRFGFEVVLVVIAAMRLNDTKCINPKISESKKSGDLNRVLNSLWQLCLIDVLEATSQIGSSCLCRIVTIAPAIAKNQVPDLLIFGKGLAKFVFRYDKPGLGVLVISDINQAFGHGAYFVHLELVPALAVKSIAVETVIEPWFNRVSHEGIEIIVCRFR
jgi:hypothetical protein